MICVECGEPVNDTFRIQEGGVIRVTRCESCKQVADRYVEHEFVIIFLDLVLHKHQAYRHILFNRLEYQEKLISPRILQLAFFVVLLDAYHKTQMRHMGGWGELASVTHWQGYTPTLESWKEFGLLLVYSMVQLALYVCALVWAAKLYFRAKYSFVKYNYLVMAIILSNFGRGFLLLLMIWDYDDPYSFGAIVELFIFSSNIVAIQVWMDQSTWVSVAITSVGWAARFLFTVVVQYAFAFKPTIGLLSPVRNSTTLVDLPVM